MLSFYLKKEDTFLSSIVLTLENIPICFSLIKITNMEKNNPYILRDAFSSTKFVVLSMSNSKTLSTYTEKYLNGHIYQIKYKAVISSSIYNNSYSNKSFILTWRWQLINIYTTKSKQIVRRAYHTVQLILWYKQHYFETHFFLNQITCFSKHGPMTILGNFFITNLKHKCFFPTSICHD